MFSKDNKVSMKRRVFAAAAAMLVTSALVVPAAAYAADNDQYTPADVPDELTTAVDEAKNAGITVTQSEDVKQPNQSASDKDYAAQVKALKELIEKAKANTEACTQAQGLAKRINDRVDELKAQYPNAKVTTRSITASDLAEYERQANNAGAENEAALNKYTTEKAEVDRHNADTKRVEDNLKNHSLYKDEASGIYVTGQWNPTGHGLGYYSKLTAHLVDAAKKGTVLFKETGWVPNSSAVKDANTQVIVNPTKASIPNGVNDSTISSGTPTALLTDVKVGTSFTITNAAEDDNGTMYDVKLEVTAIDRSNLLPGSEIADKTVNLVVGYENGTGKHRGILFDYMNANDITVKATFLDKSGNPVRSLQAFAVGDVDFHQSSTVIFNQSNLDVMNPPNSQLTCSGKRCTANFMNNVDGFNEAPKGTFAASGVGTSLTYKHEAPNANARDLTEFGLFGTGASLASDKIEYLPDPDLNLVKVSEPTCPAALTAAWHKNLVKVPPTPPTPPTPNTPPAPPATPKKPQKKLARTGVGTFGVATVSVILLLAAAGVLIVKIRAAKE